MCLVFFYLTCVSLVTQSTTPPSLGQYTFLPDLASRVVDDAAHITDLISQVVIERLFLFPVSYVCSSLEPGPQEKGPGRDCMRILPE